MLINGFLLSKYILVFSLLKQEGEYTSRLTFKLRINCLMKISLFFSGSESGTLTSGKDSILFCLPQSDPVQ